MAAQTQQTKLSSRQPEQSCNRLWARPYQAGLFKLLTIMTLANLASFVASVLFVVLLLPELAADVGGLGELGNELVDGITAGGSLLQDLLRR